MNTTKPTKAERIEIAKAHLAAGKPWRELVAPFGYKHTQSVAAFLRDNGIDYPPDPSVRSNKGKDDAWDRDEADPSYLTPEELARAKAVGIRPGRFAYLLQLSRASRRLK